MDIKSVGVIGAGQMGNGIAHVFAVAGFDVVINDISQEALDKGTGLIRRNLERQVSRDKITAETTQWYLDDMAALGALDPNEMPRATASW